MCALLVAAAGAPALAGQDARRPDAPAGPPTASALLAAADPLSAARDRLGDDDPRLGAVDRAGAVRAAVQRGADPLVRAVAAAKAPGASGDGGTSGDGGAPAPAAPSGPSAPSAALLALAQRHGVTPDADALRALWALDDLPDGQGRALVDLAVSFTAFEDAARRTFRHDRPQTAPDPAAVDAVRAARDRLLDAAVAVRDAFDGRPVRASADGSADASAGAAPIALCPAFALDLAGTATAYTQPCALVLDVGGDDTYLNNAGGNNLAPGPAGSICLDPDDLVVPTGAAAALVDLAGDDRYGDPAAPKACGVNGGGLVGAGLLVDAAGNDTYAADRVGTNGGALQGLGLLVDAAGHDTYAAAGLGTNGGGARGGAGLLVDGGGDDLYDAADAATNGGGFLGRGALLDLAGDDAYAAGALGTNGGAFLPGADGLLLDLDGHDAYRAAGGGTNGGGQNQGRGALLDLGRTGNDTYAAGRGGTNGGGSIGGAGLLLDAAGDDRYVALDGGTNGGGELGLGLLLDLDGTDTYHDTEPPGSNGSGTDATVAPKGTVGGQVDLDAAAARAPTKGGPTKP